MTESHVNNEAPVGAQAHPPQRRYVVSFLILAGAVLAFAALFYQVIRPLILPLFLATVVALLAHPLHLRLTRRLWGQGWLAAGLVTLLAVLALIVPPAATTYYGFAELHAALLGLRPPDSGSDSGEDFDARTNPRLARAAEEVSAATGTDPAQVRAWILNAGEEIEEAFYRRTSQFLGDLPGLVLGLALFVVAVFFFLKDGERIVRAWDRLTPLDGEHDAAIRAEFSQVCRGVVWGTLAAALVQAAALAAGLLAIDWAFGVEVGGWVFILALLTVVCSSIPFLGAASVWAPTALVLFAQGHHAAGVCLAAFGSLFVSQVDTVIRVWVLQGAAKLHPLLALVCVFGGIQYLGILGVFAGPVVGAVLLALLRILKKELLRFHASPPESTGERAA